MRVYTSVAPEVRFWKYVKKTDSCWLWVGTVRSNGYGQLGLKTHKTLAAHRLSYLIHRGPIPAGLVVRHKCDVPLCVNPDHLELGTLRDNTQDMLARGRVNPNQGVWSKGESNPRAKLTDRQVAEIRARFRLGATTKALASEYGMSKDYIGELVAGRRRPAEELTA